MGNGHTLGSGDVRVEEDLRAVEEVAELRLPNAEHVGRLERGAHLEAEHAVLGEDVVGHLRASRQYRGTRTSK